MVKQLDGKVALVTGASGGIGFAIADRLASSGAMVIISGRQKTQLNAAIKMLRGSGHKVEGIPFDASNEVEVDDAMREIITQHSRLDILVNNAGILLDKDIFKTSVEEWNSVISNNLTSAFLCSRAALTVMQQKGAGGRIIMIGSTAGQRGAPSGVVAYSASKAGIIGLAQTLAYTGASFNVTVNVVAPGMVQTDMLKAGFGSRIDEAAKRVPLGLGQPGDIAEAVHFLAGESARYITGATIDVNGGLYQR